MKRILLTSTALVAFAGAAAADVSWTGDAEIGYNEEVEGGFYYEAGLFVTAEAELDNGITAGAKLDFDIKFDKNNEEGADEGTWDGIDFDGSDYVLYIKNDMAALYFGDTKTAAEKLWDGVTNMEADEFLEDGDVDDGAAKGDNVDAVLRGDFNYNDIDVSLSYFLVEKDEKQTLAGLQLAAAADFGKFSGGFAYQEESEDVSYKTDATQGEIFGLWVGTEFNGVDIKLAYADDKAADQQSTGIEFGYNIKDVDLTVFYVSNKEGDDNYGVEVAYESGPIGVDAWFHDGQDEELGVEVSYEVGSGFDIYAGYIQQNGDSDQTEAYIAGTYDLGGGAEVLVSFGDLGSASGEDNDEVGDNFEVNDGTTVALTLEF